MISNKLREEEKKILETKLKGAREINERNRLCVILGRDKGYSVEELSDVLRISTASIYSYLAEYQSNQKIKNDPRGGSSSKLSEKDSQSLIKELEENTYSKVKDIVAYVASKYGINYSRSGMNLWLKEAGFVYKKPKKVPGQVNPELQEGFIKEYQELKSKLGSDEEIYFVDAVHPAHQSQASCGWIKKGEEKTLQTTGTQLRLHLNGAISLAGEKMITQEYATIDGDSMVDFLQKIEANSTAATIYVIMDNARSNKNKKVTEYLKSSRITIRYLPAYSPNLNPIERVWKLMREKKLYNRYYQSSDAFFEAVRSFFQVDVPTLVHTWGQRINDNFERIKLNPIKPVF